MKLPLRFILAFVVTSCCLQVGATGSSDGDTTKFRLATAILNDGTKVWGIVANESTDSIRIIDFNVGHIPIDRKRINSLEIDPVVGEIIVETVNGTSYFGELSGVENGVLSLRSASLGLIEIQSNTISRITLSDSYFSRKGKTWFTNPNATRYFFAPSAIPLKKREGYYQNAYLLANSVNVGITDNITVGGGVVIPLLFYVTPKVSFEVAKKFYLGGGVLLTQSFIQDFGLSAGIGYGLVTYGSYEHNVTVGAGYGFAEFDEDYKTTPMPIVTVNAMTRVGKKVSIVTENWLIPRRGYYIDVPATPQNGGPEEESVFREVNFYSGAASLGLRFMPSSRTSMDFSVVGIYSDPDVNEIVLPYLDFVYKFN